MSTHYFAVCPDCLRQAEIHSKPGDGIKGWHMHPDPNTDDKEVATSSFGGSKIGMTVSYKVPAILLDRSAWVIDSYNEVMTIGELMEKEGLGKTE